MIDILSTTKISLRALKANKMRSALSMLGIVIGVAAVVTMLAVGTGARRMIEAQISSIGTNLLMVLPGATTSGGLRMGAGTQSTLTLGDAEAVEREVSTVSAVAPILGGAAQVVYGNQNWSTAVTGTTGSMLDVREWGLSAGRPFTADDVKNASKTALLGQTVVDNLFGGIDPVGQIIRIKKIPFTIIGVLERKGQSPLGQDQDDTIYVPVTTAQKKLFGTASPGAIRMVMVKTGSLEDLDRAEKEISNLLRQRHRIGQQEENDFTVRNLTSMLQAAEQSSKAMAILLGAIASVSLIVGGVGIMNIMLVSVTERTREIGIRMAVGAKTWDIRLQFIVEALALTLLGGAIGIVAGAAGSKAVSTLAGWPTTISLFSVLLSSGFSAAVGVGFGFYPAYKASTLDPITALHYE